MREEHLQYLVCPQCGSDLSVIEASQRKGPAIETGILQCLNCSKRYSIARFIPRFVPLDNYASGFGFQWTKHARTQYDSYSGGNVSETRFFDETQWDRNLTGQTILEVGSGSGRFTEQAAATGAMVVSMDFSYAIDANYASNGRKINVLLVQADIYNMPFKKRYFDKVFCFGVLQHTPDVKKAFMALPPHLKCGGELSIDIYKKTFISTWLSTKYYVRPITRGMKPQRLYKIIQKYINLMWPLALVLARIPRLGHAINSRLLIAEYTKYGFSGDILKEMAYLDTFDMLAPKYDRPQTIGTVISWFKEAGMKEISIWYGYNGIVGLGRYCYNIENLPKSAG